MTKVYVHKLRFTTPEVAETYAEHGIAWAVVYPDPSELAGAAVLYTRTWREAFDKALRLAPKKEN